MLNIRKKVYFHQICWINTGNENISKNSNFFYSILVNLSSVEDKKDYKEVISDIRKEGNWIFGVIAKSKKTDFPLKQNFDDFSLKPLGLADNEGLFYPTHFAVYKGQILISEFNNESFRVSSFIGRRINQYLNNNNVYNTKKINIKPLIREGLREKLQNSRIRSVQLDIASSNAEIFKNDNTLRGMFNTIENAPNVVLTWGVRIKNKRSDEYYKEMESTKNKLMHIIDNYSSDIFEKMSVKVKNSNDEIEYINILDNVFKSEEEFIKIDENTKAINTEDAFLRFKEIYKKNHIELNKYLDEHD